MSVRSCRRIGLSGLVALAAAAVPLAAPGPELVPGAVGGGPGWVRGLYGEGLDVSAGAYYGLLWLALGGYLAVVFGARALPARLVWGAIVALVAAFALAPPLLSQDVFSYISYARLGVEHDLNPYAATPADVPSDPSFAHVGWPVSVSAYGPLFTLATYPLGGLGLAEALWILKATAALAVLGLAAFVARMAAARGLDSATAAAFVALNPLVLVHVVGGAHNDALMMLLLAAGCAAMLVAAERSAAAAVVAATAVKVSAAFIAPFALAGALRRRRALAAAAGAALAVALLSAAVFGADAFEALGLAGENQSLRTYYSLPSSLSRLLGIDSDIVRVVTLILYGLLVLWLLRWTLRGGDWLRAAGWAGLGLLLASAWLLPWYLLWALPLAALARDRGLMLALCVLSAWELGVRVPI